MMGLVLDPDHRRSWSEDIPLMAEDKFYDMGIGWRRPGTGGNGTLEFAAMTSYIGTGTNTANIIIGGYLFGQPTNIVYNINHFISGLSNIAQLPVNLAATGAATIENGVNGKLYVAGGTNGPTLSSGVDTLWELAVNTNTWNQKANMPVNLAACNAVALGTKLYVAGGITGSSYSNSLLEWDQTTDTWSQKADLPIALALAGGASWGNKIYIVGGKTATTTLDTLYEWDQATDTWTQKANMPSPVANTGVAFIGARLYVPGGTGINEEILETLYEWDHATDEWLTLESMLEPRRNCAIGSAGTDLSVHAGYGPSGDLSYQWDARQLGVGWVVGKFGR